MVLGKVINIKKKSKRLQTGFRKSSKDRKMITLSLKKLCKVCKRQKNDISDH